MMSSSKHALVGRIVKTSLKAPAGKAMLVVAQAKNRKENFKLSLRVYLTNREKSIL